MSYFGGGGYFESSSKEVSNYVPPNRKWNENLPAGDIPIPLPQSPKLVPPNIENGTKFQVK
jgi:hypothetical protein